jgi:hypothetical protein
MRNRLRHNSKWHLLWAIPLFILILPIILIALPFIFIADRKRVKEAKVFWKENQNKTFFFYSNKNGWGDFVINNIIPVLPENTLVYNIYRTKPNPIDKINIILDRNKISWAETRLPFIIKLTEKTPKIYSLQADYTKIKKQTSKIDEGLQEKIRQQLTKKIS